MKAYEALAAHYDRFTGDVPYDRWADYIESEFARLNISPELVLDLACGTGTLTWKLAERGFEMIGVDRSAEMLAQAQSKDWTDPENPGIRPLFLCQKAEKLDLYGTIGACVCCLDSLNYLTDPKKLARAIGKVGLFMEPGGVFLFDALTPAHFREIDGVDYVREDEDALCVYHVDFDEEESLCVHSVDIFEEADDGRYDRSFEEHEERAYTPQELIPMLRDAGFESVSVYRPFSQEAADETEPRIFYCARYRNHK